VTAVVRLIAIGSAFLALVPSDERKVRAVNEAYVSAWRNNDRAAVLATLWLDAVLIPQGGAPVRGLEAINRFWWPADGPPTTVTGFRVTTEEVGGSGAIAFTRGSFQLDFTYPEGGKTVARTNRGNYLNVFSRNASGEWRISHRMWSDLS
jgi:uncharacterized protein (TIGR02246 family)